MTLTKNMKIAAAVSSSVVVLGIALFALRSVDQKQTEVASPDHSDVTDFAEANPVGPDPSAPEIKFSQQISFEWENKDPWNEITMLVDGNPPQILKCPTPENQLSATVGFFNLDDETRAFIRCKFEDGNGVVSLSVDAADQADRKLFNVYGSEGITVDLRSWIRRNPQTNQIEIEKLEFGSESDWAKDINSPVKFSCTSSASMSVWSSTAKRFETQATEVSLDKVKRRIFVNSKCVDPQGKWMGNKDGFESDAIEPQIPTDLGEPPAEDSEVED